MWKQKACKQQNGVACRNVNNHRLLQNHVGFENCESERDINSDMSLKPRDFWSFTMLRFRTLLQLFHDKDTSAVGGGDRRPPQPPRATAAAMVPYRWNNNNNNKQWSPSFGSATFISSLRSYFPRVKLREKDHRSTTAFLFFFPSWTKWIFGSLLSLLTPTWKQSWSKFQTLEEEAEEVIEEAEVIAEVVEKVAELTEKVSAEIGVKLPENSKFKEAAHVVQNYSKEIANDAHLTQDILHKVEEWKQKLDKSETAVNEQNKKKESIANK